VGRELSLGLARLGYSIGLHYRSSKDEAIELKNEIEKLGVKCALLEYDLTSPDAPVAMLKQAIHELPKVTLLVNNASIYKQAGMLETDLKLFEQNFAIHVRTPFLLTQEFARTCGEGHVINIVDWIAYRHSVDYFAYQLSKTTLVELTYLAANALGPKIRVNAIAPGNVAPPIDEADPNYMQKRARQIPLDMRGDPKYLMQGIEYLLGNQFVTGDCLYIDGGARLRM
jgi:NAD(P)-dependent dehydrogenase (short-subunit alcohol dehydrogenase family)